MGVEPTTRRGSQPRPHITVSARNQAKHLAVTQYYWLGCANPPSVKLKGETARVPCPSHHLLNPREGAAEKLNFLFSATQFTMLDDATETSDSHESSPNERDRWDPAPVLPAN